MPRFALSSKTPIAGLLLVVLVACSGSSDAVSQEPSVSAGGQGGGGSSSSASAVGIGGAAQSAGGGGAGDVAAVGGAGGVGEAGGNGGEGSAGGGGGGEGAGGAATDCSVNGAPGQCIDVSACAALIGYSSTPGYCPGPANIECCTMMPSTADNPPIPDGYELMAQADVTQEMTDWAVTILNDPTDYPMFSTTIMTFGTRMVLARVEWHPPDFQNGVVHRGVTLYVPI